MGESMKIFQTINMSILFLLVILLSGCVMPTISIEDLSELKNDEVVFVGKLALKPHMSKDEVVYENIVVLGGSKDDLHKVLYLKVSDQYYKLEGSHAMDMSDTVATSDGKYFFFAWKKNKPLNILGTSFITRWTQTHRDFMTLSINKGINVRHSGKSRAVYVGNITFERDEFFNIKNIDINQKGYKKAKRAFQKKYKTNWKLEKAKLYSSR